MEYKSLNITQNVVTALFDGVTYFQMNNLRRALYEVFSYCLASIVFHHNDSPLSDEDVAYRLQAAPIFFGGEYNDDATLEFYVDVRANGKVLWVTSRDLTPIGHKYGCVNFKKKGGVIMERLVRVDDWILLDKPAWIENVLLFLKGFPVFLEEFDITHDETKSGGTFSKDGEVFRVNFDDKNLMTEFEYKTEDFLFVRKYERKSTSCNYVSALSKEGESKRREVKSKGGAWYEIKTNPDLNEKIGELELSTVVDYKGKDFYYHAPIVKLRGKQSLRLTAVARRGNGMENACFNPAILPYYKKIGENSFEFTFTERGNLPGKLVLEKAIEIALTYPQKRETYDDKSFFEDHRK